MAAAGGGVRFLNRSDAVVTSIGGADGVFGGADGTTSNSWDATHKLPDTRVMITPSQGPQVVTHKHAHSNTKALARTVKKPAQCVIAAFVKCQHHCV